MPTLLKSLEKAGGFKIDAASELFNFRLVDYNSRPTKSIAPRCGAHVDFGTLTIVVADHPGLEVEINGQWKTPDVKFENGGSVAFVVFGWCTAIRSNNRITAVLFYFSTAKAFSKI